MLSPAKGQHRVQAEPPSAPHCAGKGATGGSLHTVGARTCAMTGTACTRGVINKLVKDGTCLLLSLPHLGTELCTELETWRLCLGLGTGSDQLFCILGV